MSGREGIEDGPLVGGREAEELDGDRRGFGGE